MKKAYVSPVIKKISFEYKILTTSSDRACNFIIINLGDMKNPGPNCIGGTPNYLGVDSASPK